MPVRTLNNVEVFLIYFPKTNPQKLLLTSLLKSSEDVMIQMVVQMVVQVVIQMVLQMIQMLV